MGAHIGNDCIVHENTIIDAEGFGCKRNQDGHPIHFTHLADVEIGNNVCVEVCSDISKSALIDTKISDYAKINAQVMMDYNAQVGKLSYIHVEVVVSGGCKIGPERWIVINATVLE